MTPPPGQGGRGRRRENRSGRTPGTAGHLVDSPPATGPLDEDADGLVARYVQVGAERVIGLCRWVALVIVAARVYLPGQPGPPAHTVTSLVGGWTLFNLAAMLGLMRGHVPSRPTQLAMLAVDVGVAATLVHLTGGFHSSLGIIFYLLLVAASLRFDLAASLLFAGLLAVVYLGIGVITEPRIAPHELMLFPSRLFLLLVTATAGSLFAREMVQSRERRLLHSLALERAAADSLRELARLKSDFITIAAHELRTPLTTMNSSISLLADLAVLPAPAREEAIESLRSETAHLMGITETLVNIARLDGDCLPLRIEPVGLEGLLSAVLTRLARGGGDHRFDCRVGAGSEAVRADPERLATVLSCVIGNALRFSPGGEPVHVWTRRRGPWVDIEVRDHGRPIATEHREKIFHSFYQVESPLTRQRGGCGVGLYLARQLARRMGGDVTVDGGGENSFIVSVPAGPPAPGVPTR